MKLKVGDTFKFIPHHSDDASWTDKVTGETPGGEYLFLTIHGTGIDELVSHSPNWVKSDNTHRVIKVNHYNTKLGKILYK